MLRDYQEKNGITSNQPHTYTHPDCPEARQEEDPVVALLMTERQTKCLESDTFSPFSDSNQRSWTICLTALSSIVNSVRKDTQLVYPLTFGLAPNCYSNAFVGFYIFIFILYLKAQTDAERNRKTVAISGRTHRQIETAAYDAFLLLFLTDSNPC